MRGAGRAGMGGELYWGIPPWRIEFQAGTRLVPSEADFAVIGGGFTGLAAAAWLRHIAPEKSAVLLEKGRIGSGASGRTGGLALAETAAGDLPGLGDVLGGFSQTLRELGVECELGLPGVWELARRKALPHSPVCWNDAGELRAVAEVAGGTVEPGKMVSGLARAAAERGAIVCEAVEAEGIEFGARVRIRTSRGELSAGKVLLACNAQSLELSALAGTHEPKFTLATATGPFSREELRELGLDSGKPFYTVELPYLWGRLMSNGGIIFGAGLIHLKDWRELQGVDVGRGEARAMFERLEERVRKFHPVLRKAEFTHRWGGPILVGAGWDMRPVFRRHPQSEKVLVLGAYAGHGVALSVYLGRWAAEVMAGRRDLPQWG